MMTQPDSPHSSGNTRYASPREIDKTVEQAVYQFEHHGLRFLRNEMPYLGKTFIALLGKVTLRNIPELSDSDECCISLSRPEYLDDEMITDYLLEFDFTSYVDGKIAAASYAFLTKGEPSFMRDTTQSASALAAMLENPKAAQEQLAIHQAERHVARLVPDPTRTEELDQLDLENTAITTETLLTLRRLTSLAIYSLK
jgi:hypothetical protein